MIRFALFPLLALLSACASTPASEPAAEPLPVSEAAAPAPAAPSASHFGAPFTLEEVTPASALLDDPANYVEKTVRVEGRVADVCQKAGCWMVIADGDRNMRVLMKDHAFSVAKDGAGATCHVEGVVQSKPIDPATVAHFEEESANKAVIPEKQAEGGFTYELVASGVEFVKKQ